MKFKKIKLISPILVKAEKTYENPWDSSDDYYILNENEKKKCFNDIYTNVCEILSPIFLPTSLDHIIYSAVPAVEINNGQLKLSLSCECYHMLTESEINALCKWWKSIIAEANEYLCKKHIKTKKNGRILILLWFMKDWTIETVFPDSKGDKKYEDTKK